MELGTSPQRTGNYNALLFIILMYTFVSDFQSKLQFIYFWLRIDEMLLTNAMIRM